MKRTLEIIEENEIDEKGHVFIDDNVTVIAIDPYKEYYDRIKSITFGLNVQIISDYSFYRFKNLKFIMFLTDHIIYIGKCAFCKCSSLKSIDLSKCFVGCDLNNSTFKDCESLEKVILNKNLRSIYYEAFADCINLKNINLEDTKVEVIGEESFINCKSLKKIILPNTVDSIGDNAFVECNAEFEMNLSRVTFNNNVFNGKKCKIEILED